MSRRYPADAPSWDLFPLPSVMLAAILFGGIIRVVELYVIGTSSREAFFVIWNGGDSLGIRPCDAVHVVGLLFLTMSILEGFTPRSLLSRWMEFGVCLTVATYTGLLRHLTQSFVI